MGRFLLGFVTFVGFLACAISALGNFCGWFHTPAIVVGFLWMNLALNYFGWTKNILK